PIKYFNKEINGAYKELERGAELKLLSMLPKELSEEYAKSVIPDENSEEYKIMKLADKIAAYIKCVEEVKAGNKEFVKAKKTIKHDLDSCTRDEVKYFIKNILPCYEKTLDELD
ncbi:MAG: 5'-deoxynucleotidase, partial [Clostridia bacterium]|nr:5'-deoxynucleotidase [Clostridia bacterium]